MSTKTDRYSQTGLIFPLFLMISLSILVFSRLVSFCYLSFASSPPLSSLRSSPFELNSKESSNKSPAPFSSVPPPTLLLTYRSPYHSQTFPGMALFNRNFLTFPRYYIPFAWYGAIDGCFSRILMLRLSTKMLDKARKKR